MVNAFLPDPQVWLIYAARRAALGGAVAAAAVAGGADPPHRRATTSSPRRSRCPRSGCRSACWPDRRSAACCIKAVGVGLVLRRRRRRPGRRHRAVRAAAALPARRTDATRPACRGIVRRPPLRRPPPGPARHLPRRHRRDVHGDADRAVPRARRGRASRDPRCSACSTPPGPSAAWSRPPPPAGPRACTTTAAPWSLAAMAWGASVALAGLLHQHLGWCWSASRSPAPPTWSAASSAATIWHQTIPDSMRGRLAGIEMLSYSLGPLGGQARAGLVADRCGVRAVDHQRRRPLRRSACCRPSAWLRDFWSYDDRTDEHAVRERAVRARPRPGPPRPGPGPAPSCTAHTRW